MKFIWLLTLLLLSVSCSNNDFILNSQLKLGNCTDVSNDDFNSRFKLFDEFDSNLKKFFYSDYKFGSVNITNVFSVAGANYTHQKIEYYNSASSVLAYIRDVDFKSLDHENNESQNIYIGFGRKNSISSAFEYDIIINIHKDQIQPVDAHNTEFELSSNQAKITYRSALQNLLTDVMPKEFRLSMKVRNTIYPSVSLSAVINMDSTGENFTAIEINCYVQRQRCIGKEMQRRF